MSLVTEHMKAKKVLDEVLSGKIKSYEEVVKRIGNSDFYKLWAKNIWELHTTEAPSADLKIRQPSKVPQKKDWEVLCVKCTDSECTEKVYVVNCYTSIEAFEIVKNYLGDDDNCNYAYSIRHDSFEREVIKLKV